MLSLFIGATIVACAGVGKYVLDHTTAHIR